jgi:hypothetical protein
MGYWFGMWLGVTLISSALGQYVAWCKGRNLLEGFAFGLFLGPIGVLVEAMLPTVVIPQFRSLPDEDDEDDFPINSARWDIGQAYWMPKVKL